MSSLVSATSNSAVAQRAWDWHDLERYVAAAFHANGFEVFLQGGFRPDGGVDLAIVAEGQVTVVQCKAWERRVGVQQVRELLGAMVDFRARKSCFVSTSGFTEEAERFARRNGMQLIDRPLLENGLARLAGQAEFQEALDYFSSRCPDCGARLVARVNGKTNERFWGCSTYPHCDHTEPWRHRRMLEPLPAKIENESRS